MTPEEQYSEIPAIEQLQSLGYTYFKAKDLPSNERAATQEVLLKNQLKTAIARLNPWMNDHAQRKAFQKITQVDGNSLMEINEQIWHLLRGNNFNLADEQGNFHPVRYIDYTEIDQNEFWVIQQMSFKNNAGRLSIPDLLLYVNGLPLVVIECKSPNISAPWDEAYSELTAYQDLNPDLFHYNQFCAGIWQTGGRYGAIEDPQKFYSVFKQKNAEGMKQQAILIANLLAKERLLDILRHFIIFETDEGRTLKKLPRYQQLRATNRAIRKLQEGKGGVIWHTQGSGKSITMVYLTRKLQAPEYGFKNPTVLVLTDRTDLDTQITNTFINIGFKNIYHADSVAGLELLLQNDYGGIITSTVQKFQEQEEQDEKSKAKKKGRWGRKKAKQKQEKATPKAGDKRVQKKLHDGKLLKVTQILQENGKWQESEREEIELKELSQKENLYVLVDEAHRSQYGFLAAFMRSVIPKAKFVAFTGTPISKKDKSTLNEFYGGDYIDVYTIKESVADGATVELLYDQGIALLKVKKKKLDKKFKKKFGKASKAKQDKLKRAALKKYALSKKRMKAISQHIIEHFRDKIRPDHHKAMLVCQGRPMAIRYQKIFTQLRAEGFHDFESKAVMSLGSVKKDKIAKE
ncbi:MAG: type I restriction endonuclease subunit R, partial [Chitinophagales bacterium]